MTVPSTIAMMSTPLISIDEKKPAAMSLLKPSFGIPSAMRSPMAGAFRPRLSVSIASVGSPLLHPISNSGLGEQSMFDLNFGLDSMTLPSKTRCVSIDLF